MGRHFQIAMAIAALCQFCFVSGVHASDQGPRAAPQYAQQQYGQPQNAPQQRQNSALPLRGIKSRYGYVEGYVGAVVAGKIETSDQTVIPAGQLGNPAPILVQTTDSSVHGTSVLGGVALGYRVPLGQNFGLRGEVDTSISPVKFEGLGTNGTLFGTLANIWLDLESAAPVTPYFGGGVGLGGVTQTLLDDSPAIGFAYQVGGGIRSRIPNTDVFIGINYRYFVAMLDGQDFALDPTALTVIASSESETDVRTHRATVSLGTTF